jgi:hypothetical protein
VHSNDGGEIVPTGDIDPAAQELAPRIGGTASVQLSGFGNREFDAVSDAFVAQTTGAASAALRPKNFLSSSRRAQIRETLAAAHATGRQALFEFRGVVPDTEVTRFIERNARRIGVRARVDIV